MNIDLSRSLLAALGFCLGCSPTPSTGWDGSGAWDVGGGGALDARPASEDASIDAGWDAGARDAELLAADIGVPDGAAADATPDSGFAGAADSAGFEDAGWTDAAADGGGRNDGGFPCGAVEDFIPGWAKNPAITTEIYVSASTGDDTHDGSSPAKALRSAAAAFLRMGPGIRLNFGAGTYNCPSLDGPQASPDHPAVLRSSDAPLSAKFDCGGTGTLWIYDGPKGLIIDGIEVFNTSGHGIQLAPAGSLGTPWTDSELVTDVVVMNSYIHDTGLAQPDGGVGLTGASIKTSQGTRISVINNRVARAAPGRQNFEFVAVDNVVLAGNEASESDSFDEVKGGAQHAVIYRNYIHDMRVDGILVGGNCTCLPCLVHTDATYEAMDVRVWDNVIANADNAAFSIVACQDCVIENNTFYAAAAGHAMFMVADGFGDGCNTPPGGFNNTNLIISNNIFASSGGFPWMIASNRPPANLTMTNNLWWAGPGGVKPNNSDVPFFGEPSSLYDEDPAFVAAPGDLHLGTASPARAKGTTAASWNSGSSEGKCWSSPPNIGAY
jgi:hypothetical protein